MTNVNRKTRFRFWLWLIRVIGVIVPRRLRADWRQEWEAELRYRERLLAEWERLDWRNKLELMRRSTSAFWDALWLQPLRWEDEMIQDIRFGVRMLLKSKGFTAVAVLSLALGIGANTAIFSLVDAVLLKKLPVKNPEELVLFKWISGPHTMATGTNAPVSRNKDGLRTSASFSYAAYEQFRAHDRSLAALFAFAQLEQLNVNVGGQAEIASGLLVSGGYYSGLGVQTILGRPIRPEDDRSSAHPVAVISYRYWQRRFGLDTAVVGRTINLNNNAFTVIGVTPPEFRGTLQVGNYPDLSIPLAQEPLVRAGGRQNSALGEPANWWLQIMGRLQRGVGAEQVRAGLEGVYQQSVREGWAATPEAKTSGNQRDLPRLLVTSGSQGLMELREAYSQPLGILMIVVGLVLLIACANLANLLLARSVTRRKEISVRLALGARRSRLVRQLLTESLLLACIGGACGVLFAYWGKDLLLALRPWGGDELPLDLNLDQRVMAFTAVVSLLTGLLFGLAPALRSTRVDLTPALKENAQHPGVVSRSLTNKALIITQVALSLVLLIGAGLFIRTLRNLQGVEIGFNRDNVLLFRVDPRLNNYKGEQIPNLYQQMIERIRSVPDVLRVSFSRHSLLSGGGAGGGVAIQGRGWQMGKDDLAHELWVGPDFLAAMEIPILRGRGLTGGDDARAPKVAIVNQTFAQRFFPDGDPLGQRFTFERYLKPNIEPDPKYVFEIVGVVRDAKYRSLRQPTPPTVYAPAVQNPAGLGQTSFAVRTAGDPITLIPAIRAAVQEVDGNLPLFEFTTFDQNAEKSLAQERLFARLTSFFGLIALILASIGLYGVMAYSVMQRTREIGIRMALGAKRGDVLRLIMRQTLWLALAGVMLGIAASLVGTRWIASQLFGLAPYDPLTITLVTLLLLAVMMLAGYMPARRAAKVDPLIALRCE